MPIRYELDREAKLIDTRCEGAVTFAEVLAHFDELAGLAPLPSPLDVLLDLSAQTSLPETPQITAVASALERLGAVADWGAWAIVAADDALYGMLRMFQVFAEDHVRELQVFRERSEAESWLRAQRAEPR